MKAEKLAWVLFFLGISVGFVFNEIFALGKLRLIVPLIFMVGISGTLIVGLMHKD
jgi:hypothetical protein